MAKILLALTELIVDNIWILFITAFLFAALVFGKREYLGGTEQ